MTAVPSLSDPDNAFVRIDALASESLSPDLFSMYETYRDALKAAKVDSAFIVMTLALFLFETSMHPNNRSVH